MSIAYVDGQIDAVRAEASRAQASHAAHVREINSDLSLSDTGRATRLAESLESTKHQLDALKAKELKLVDDEISRLERQLDAKAGSTSSDLIAFRDAQDRAERIEGAEEATRVLERAMRTDDRSLAHAVFRRALDAGWRSTIEAFGSADPGLADVAKDLTIWKKFRQPDMSRAMAYGAGW